MRLTVQLCPQYSLFHAGVNQNWGAMYENSYVTYGASLDSSLNFEKFGENGSLHELIPRAKLLIREPNKNPSSEVRFDTLATTADADDLAEAQRIDTASELFLDNPISGGDLAGDTREIALSLTSRGINGNGIETYRITAGRTIFLQDRGITLFRQSRNHGTRTFGSRIKRKPV